MNVIPKDPYADELLVNIITSKPGAAIKRDVYADRLLNYVHKETSTSLLPVDNEVPAYVARKDVEKQH